MVPDVVPPETPPPVTESDELPEGLPPETPPPWTESDELPELPLELLVVPLVPSVVVLPPETPPD